MADNITAPATGAVLATDDIGGVHYPRSKLSWGVEGAAVDASATNPLPVTVTGAGDATAANQTTQITATGGLTETAPATDTASSGLNGRLQRIAQRLTTLMAQIPTTLGIKTAANSLSIAPASDASFAVSAASLPLPTGAATAANQAADAVLVGGVTETAPASDTASSGLNGRLQRIAQRLTSLIGQIPATLGIKTAANSLSIAPASDASFAVTAASLPLPAGAATSAKQDAIVSAIGSIAAGGDATAANQVAHSTLFGGVTETAPASDIASSGLNGRLQRIAQRLTTMMAQLPTSLGVKTAANSLSVTHASDDAVLAAMGAIGDTAWAGSGNASHTALLKTIATALMSLDDALEYELVAASVTDQMMGPTGAAGDYIESILVIPTSLSPGAISIEDGAANTPVFAGGTNSLSNLVPFEIPLGISSVTGGWEITTGANMSLIVKGNFA